MKNHASKSVTITFEVRGIPDHSGLRIKTINPPGLYVSSVEPDAAIWHLEATITELAHERKLLIVQKNEGILLSAPIDWNAAKESGSGSLTLRHVSEAEVRALMPGSERITRPPCIKLEVRWFIHPKKKIFCVVFDHTDRVDAWLLESLQFDIENDHAGKILQ